MITVLIGIIVGLLAVALIMLLIHRQPTSTPASTPTPPAPTPTRATTVVTPCPTRQGSGWFGGIGGFMWGLVKVVLSIAIILVILGGLYFGGLWAKNKIDSWAGQNDYGVKELVVIRPGLYTTVDTADSTLGKFMPPVATLVEYLDQSGNPIPVECNGVLAYSIVSQPGIDFPVIAPEGLRFLRLSSANPDSGEYSFVINKK
jgi:hypothetical protein